MWDMQVHSSGNLTLFLIRRQLFGPRRYEGGTALRQVRALGKANAGDQTRPVPPVERCWRQCKSGDSQVPQAWPYDTPWASDFPSFPEHPGQDQNHVTGLYVGLLGGRGFPGFPLERPQTSLALPIGALTAISTSLSSAYVGRHIDVVA